MTILVWTTMQGQRWCGLLLMGLTAGVATAQPPASIQINAEPRFEVVSIRPSAPGDKVRLGATADGFVSHAEPIIWLLEAAYSPDRWLIGGTIVY